MQRANSFFPTGIMSIDTTTRLNGVDIAAIGGLAQAIQADSANARSTRSARVVWNGAFASEARIRGFVPVQSDEPTGLGGADDAPNSVEQLLGAPGNCRAVGYTANATVAGVKLDRLQIDLNGNFDLHVFLGLVEGRAGFDTLNAIVTLESEAIEALHARVLATSPVGHTLCNAVPVDVTLG